MKKEKYSIVIDVISEEKTPSCKTKVVSNDIEYQIRGETWTLGNCKTRITWPDGSGCTGASLEVEPRFIPQV